MDILTSTNGGILTVTFNRLHKKNALTAAMYVKLAEVLETAQTDAATRVLLMTGHPSVFTSGNDIEDFALNPPTSEDAPVMHFLRQLNRFPKPVVAAVAGPAVGVGTTLLLHCDLVYAADNARFAMPFAQLGLCPEAASSLLLPLLVGYRHAAEKLLLGEPFSAEEAAQIGLINRVLPAAELDAFAQAQAAKLAVLPPGSLRVTKALMKKASLELANDQMSAENSHFMTMLVSPEAKEAFNAFREKRRPNFHPFA